MDNKNPVVVTPGCLAAIVAVIGLIITGIAMLPASVVFQTTLWAVGILLALGLIAEIVALFRAKLSRSSSQKTP